MRWDNSLETAWLTWLENSSESFWSYDKWWYFLALQFSGHKERHLKVFGSTSKYDSTSSVEKSCESQFCGNGARKLLDIKLPGLLQNILCILLYGQVDFYCNLWKRRFSKLLWGEGGQSRKPESSSYREECAPDGSDVEMHLNQVWPAWKRWFTTIF